MKTHSNQGKKAIQKNASSSKSALNNGSKIENNRSDSTLQKSISNLAQNSPQMAQLNSYQEMGNEYSTNAQFAHSPVQMVRINKKGKESMFGDFDTVRSDEFFGWVKALTDDGNVKVLKMIQTTLSGKKDLDTSTEMILSTVKENVAKLELGIDPYLGRLVSLATGEFEVLDDHFKPDDMSMFVIDKQTDDGIVEYYHRDEVFPQVSLDLIGEELKAKLYKKGKPLPLGRLCTYKDGSVEVLETDYRPSVEEYESGKVWIDLQTSTGKPDWYVGEF